MNIDNKTIKVPKLKADGVVLKKTAIANIILIISLTSPAFIPYKFIPLVVLIFAIILVFMSSFRFPSGLGFIVVPIAVIMCAGMIFSLDNSPYLIGKDLWYVSKPVLIMFVGYMLMFHIVDLKKIFQAILISSSITALIHIYDYIMLPEYLKTSLVSIRSEAGDGYFITIIAIAVIAVAWRARIKIFPRYSWLAWILAILALISICLAFSRTLWVSLFIMLTIVLELYNYRNIRRVALYTTLLFVLAFIVFSTSDSERFGDKKTTMGKLANSIKEISISDYSNRLEITRNWRGYQSHRGVETYLEGSAPEYIFGRGFGTMIDMELYAVVGKDLRPIRYVPMTHNGYVFILVKAGLVGLIVFLFYLYRFFHLSLFYSKSDNRYTYITAKIVMALTFVLAFTTIIILGFFTKFIMTPFLVVYGALIAFMRLHEYDDDGNPVEANTCNNEELR
jgi:O-antigen ligase